MTEHHVGLDLSRSVLIVDDFGTMLRILCNQLTEIGFEAIETATSGEEALMKLRQKPFGLVISDCNMHPMSGVDLLRAMRAETSIADTPFVMITSDSRTQTLLEARAEGADGHVVKPFSAQTLRSKIALACAA